jgi:hypothetical protein
LAVVVALNYLPRGCSFPCYSSHTRR